MKTVLAIETSSPALSVALGTSAGRIKEFHSSSSLKHSENLIPLIDRLLRGEGIALGDIDAFAIDRGPGSFTGLRIGFSLLKGFLVAKKKPCYGALSLDMIAAKVRLAEGCRLGVVIDARREEIYSRFYRFRKGERVAERKLELLSLSELITRVSNRTALAGDALVRYRQPLEKEFGNQILFLDEKYQFPSARTLVSWFQAQDGRLTALKAPGDFIPLYFRASEAEEKIRK